MGLTSTCSLQFTRKTGSETGGQEEPRLIRGAGGQQEIGCVLEMGADPTPAQALFYHKQKPQLAEEAPNPFSLGTGKDMAAGG